MLAAHVALAALLVGTQAFFTALAVRNLRYSAAAVDRERDWLAAELGIEDVDELHAYHRLTTGLSQLRSWLGLGVLLLGLYSGAFADTVAAVDDLGLGPVAEGVVFLLGLSVAVAVFSLPFDVVDTFVVDELFDFNRQGVRLWLRDTAVSLAVGGVITAVLAGAVLAFVELLGAWWWVAGWAFFVAFALAMNVVYPRVIAPLFNEFVPVEAGELREAVESVFDRAGFECEQIYTMDASRRSSRVNAYFVGFGRTKRVVLFDTLVERLDLDAVQSVLAHELAHWKRAHVWKLLAGESLRMLVLFAALGYLVGADWVYAMFDLDASFVAAGLAIGLVWLAPLTAWSSPLSNRLSLRFEREADRFAVEVMGSGDGLVDALADLTRENLGNPFPHPWYEAFHYSHPPVPERIRAIREHDSATA
ncbi:MAG: M48 family metallopeptidase [Halobacteriales archaeon]